MKSDLVHVLEKVQNVDEVRAAVLTLLKEMREVRKFDRIGFVSGIIFSEGIQFKKRNLNRLSAYTQKLQKTNEYPIFSAVDIFYNGLFERLPESKLPEIKRRPIFFAFWKNIMESGYITDLFMTPRWEKSQGARDEIDKGKKIGMTIHYVEEDPDISKMF